MDHNTFRIIYNESDNGHNYLDDDDEDIDDNDNLPDSIAANQPLLLSHSNNAIPDKSKHKSKPMTSAMSKTTKTQSSPPTSATVPSVGTQSDRNYYNSDNEYDSLPIRMPEERRCGGGVLNRRDQRKLHAEKWGRIRLGVLSIFFFCIIYFCFTLGSWEEQQAPQFIVNIPPLDESLPGPKGIFVCL